MGEATGIHRRYTCPSRDGDGDGPHLLAHISVREPGVQCTSRENSDNTNPRNKIPRHGSRLANNGTTPTKPGDKETEAGGCKDQRSVSPTHNLRVSRLLGKFNSFSQAVPSGPLFCRAIQRDLTAALERGSQYYDTLCQLSLAAKEELFWWTNQLTHWNGMSLVRRQLDLQIESDASLIGWGTYCQGTRTGGPWSQEEKNLHMNCLELLAATLAVKKFL